MQNKLPLLGFFILSYLLYRRLFLVRLPKEICSSQDLFSISITLFLCISTFIIACVYLYTFIKFLLNKEDIEPSTNPLIIKIILLYQSKWNPIIVIQNSLLALDIYLKNKIPMYDEHRDYLDLIIVFISKFFCKYDKVFSVMFLLMQNSIICIKTAGY